MKNFFKILIIALLVFFGLIYIQERESLIYPFLGRTKPQPLPSRDFIQGAIMDFNNSLVEAYEKGDAGKIKGADAALKEQIGFEIDFLKGKGWAFMPRFSRLDISDIRFEGGSIKAVASEDWNIKIFDHTRQEEILKDEMYKVTYTLENTGKGWVITAIYPEREAAKKPGVNG